MVRVEFETAEGDVIATLDVGAAGIERITDATDVIDFTAVTIGVHTGKRTTFDDDPQEWARSLPRIYRNAYLRAVVVDDDNPYTWLNQEPIEIGVGRLVGA